MVARRCSTVSLPAGSQRSPDSASAAGAPGVAAVSAAAVSATRYFGPELTETVDRYFANLDVHPPPYLLASPVVRPALAAKLAREYRPVLRLPPAERDYAGPPLVLYRRVTAGGSPP